VNSGQAPPVDDIKARADRVACIAAVIHMS
jgi:hypothetical protein